MYRETNNSPTTPESQHRELCTANQLERLQMTDPDQWHDTVLRRGLPQPDFLENIAASIPQVEIPVPIYVSQQSALAPAPVIDSVAGPSTISSITSLLAAIPEVRLPAGWDSPLQNPIPIVPPVPIQQSSRRRGRGRDSILPAQSVSLQEAREQYHTAQANADHSRRDRGRPRGRGSILPAQSLQEAREHYEAAQAIVPREQVEQQRDNRLVNQAAILANQPGLVDPRQPLNIDAIREAARR